MREIVACNLKLKHNGKHIIHPRPANLRDAGLGATRGHFLISSKGRSVRRRTHSVNSSTAWQGTNDKPTGIFLICTVVQCGRVKNTANGKTVDVGINDKGPHGKPGNHF